MFKAVNLELLMSYSCGIPKKKRKKTKFVANEFSKVTLNSGKGSTEISVEKPNLVQYKIV